MSESETLPATYTRPLAGRGGVRRRETWKMDTAYPMGALQALTEPKAPRK
jgi:hypothetical protein